MKKYICGVVILMVCSFNICNAAEFFVSPKGKDESGKGSIDAPYKTILHVLDHVAEPGDIITLRAGTYNEEVRIRKPSITIRSMEGERAVISMPTDLDELFMPVIFDVESKGSVIQNLEIIGGFYGIFFFSEWDWDDTPLDNDAAKNIIIEDCIIHDTGRDCIKLPAGCDNITIRRCEIYNSGMGYPQGTPDDDKNAEGIDVVNCDGVIVQDCYIHDTATTGIYIKGGSQDSIIERCRIQRCGGMGIGVGFDTSPEFFDLAANPEYYENIRGLVRNCLVKDTQNAGIGLYASKDAQIYNNTIINTARQYHSPIYFGLTFQDWDENAGRPANINPVIMNNIIVQEKNIHSPCISIRYSEAIGQMNGLKGNIQIDNNLYFQEGGTCYFEDGRLESELANASLAQWRAHIAGDTRSMALDPLLDTTFHLKSGSPCIDKGSHLIPGGLPSTDLDNHPRVVNQTVDLGAYEFMNINKNQ